ncbi:hypothetical protein [Streptomyces litmocidini]
MNSIISRMLCECAAAFASSSLVYERRGRSGRLSSRKCDVSMP